MQQRLGPYTEVWPPTFSMDYSQRVFGDSSSCLVQGTNPAPSSLHSVDSRPATRPIHFFLRLLVLVRQVGQSLKKITRYRDVRSEFDTTFWKRQLIDFARLTSPLSAVEPEVRTNRITSQRMPMRLRLEEATVGSTFHSSKVTPDGPLTQMCTMKCPRCGSTASKEKPEEQFRCERCGWKL